MQGGPVTAGIGAITKAQTVQESKAHLPLRLATVCAQASLQVELATEFRSGKIPWNRLGMVSAIPWSTEAFRGLRKSQFRSSERNDMKKIVLHKILIHQTEFTACICPRHAL